jgi:hypothetical protein
MNDFFVMGKKVVEGESGSPLLPTLFPGFPLCPASFASGPDSPSA